MPAPNTLQDIINKVRRITGRPSAAEITNDQIINYINTFYIYDMPEHLHLQSLRYNYQFITNPNQQVYDFPKELYLTNMPPVFIAGYQSYMTQSRENFFRINPKLMMNQASVATGNGTPGPYTFTLTQTPITRGFKPNPPGAYSTSVIGTNSDIAPKDINWNVLISSNISNTSCTSVVDDGKGNLFDINAASSDPATAIGTIDYFTGAVTVTFTSNIPNGTPINAQYVPYVASRPQSVVFYQDQFILYPIPDQAYTVSFEAYKYPTAFLSGVADLATSPQLAEWWQLLAYGAADKIFADNGDIENLQKFRPLLDEQMKLVTRRTIVQQTSERSATIYTEQSQLSQFPFGNMFGGF
jgi:hypothetical protein